MAGGTKHLIVQSTLPEQLSGDISREAAREDDISDVFTSSVREMTATIRGAPVEPLKMRVEAIKDRRFWDWTCLALFRRLRRD